jgi:tRNA pseudouridine38-40 synthase
MDAIAHSASVSAAIAIGDGQVPSLPCVEIVLDDSDLLAAAAAGTDGVEISIKFEKDDQQEQRPEDDQVEEGPQTEFVNRLDGVEVRVYLDGSETVDVEIIPPVDADDGEDGQVLANLDTPQGRLEEVVDTDEREVSAVPCIEDNVAPLTSVRVDQGVESETSGSSGVKKRTREEEDLVRNLKSKSDQTLEESGAVDTEAEESKGGDANLIIEQNSAKHVDANELKMGDQNSVKPVIEEEVEIRDQHKEGSHSEEKVDSNHDVKKLGLRKRRKIAMLLAYCGAGYQGMQKNPGAVTIEGELEKALVKADAMPLNFDGNPRKVDWMRAARTDKGVSAVGQVVSGLFYIDPPGFVERVNNHLPKEIRVLGFKRVIPSFSAKQLCDRRRYEYVIPMFALDPTAHTDREYVVLKEGSEEAYRKCLEHCGRGRHALGSVDKDRVTLGSEQPGNSAGSHVDISKNVIETVVACEERKANGALVSSSEEQVSSLVVGEGMVQTNSAVKEVNTFHFGDSEQTKLNHIFKRFVGTHNFHNFTSKIKGEDPSAKRYIISFEVGNVFSVGGTEFVRCTIVGQSFMLHQIRKMVGLSIAVFRGCAPESMIDLSLRRLI